jgi:hypothetical protein
LKVLLTSFFIILSILGFSQIPDSIIFDWQNVGNELDIRPEKKRNVLDCELVNDGVFDNTGLLQSIVNAQSADSQLVIFFPAGRYKFSKTIYLKSNITILGEGATKTFLIFDNAGKGSLFEISAIQSASFFSVTKGLGIHSKVIETDSVIIPNACYELLVDGKGLATSDWAMKSIGQIFKIDSFKNSNAYLSTELKLDYYKYSNPRIRLITPIENVHFRFFSLERRDATTEQTNNFNFMYATNCTVIGVESNKSNMSHVAFNKSYRCKVADSYFHHAFDYGGGGKAYGAELSSSSSNCLIENNIFDNLRHSILLQSGANGNVISGNYSINPFWKEGILPANSAGELVLHGNYPFANLFEGNEVGNIVVDNSHGFNGPGNVFYRNKASLWGVFMNNGAGNATHFVGNEIIGTLNNLTGIGNVNYLNFTISTDTSVYKNVIVPQSLYLKTKPEWWPSKKSYPALGLPLTKQLASISAKYRYNHDSLRALNSSPDIFLANFHKSLSGTDSNFVFELESKLQVNVISILLERLNKNMKSWEPYSPDFSNKFLFKQDVVRDTLLLTSETFCYRWIAKGIKNQEWVSDSFCVNKQSANAQNYFADKVLIYPNPAIDFVKINLPKASLIKFYTIYGEVLLSEKFKEGFVTIDVTHFSKANYYIEVFDGINYFRQLVVKL